MKEFFRIARFIWDHPLASRKRITAFRRFFGWQIGQRIMRYPVVYPLVEDSVLLVQKGMAGATGNIYTGLLEFTDMAFIMHVLRQEDVFGDIGANIGVYTVLASRNAGARTIAVEPIPSTVKRLQQNIELNGISGMVTLCNCGVGEKRETLKFTSTEDTVNHVANDKEMADGDVIVEVPVQILDELFAGESPVVLKMDIEGFEWPALRGASKLLASSSLKALVIELNGSGARYGYSDEQIDKLLLSYGFRAFTYDPFLRKFSPQTGRSDTNTLYIKDLDWVSRRCSEARKYLVLEQEV